MRQSPMPVSVTYGLHQQPARMRGKYPLLPKLAAALFLASPKGRKCMLSFCDTILLTVMPL